ncbi:iron-siderophore ABC transporter substrate-binding protein [Kineococcus sp. SYSU DK003]|uniref:iron-siderophore ABC transporter substrate-binding protein n=1 Tax=Kineococcus sp. SYSU DK003 TaxID=3383124 RepID=UPI003D7C3BD9
MPLNRRTVLLAGLGGVAALSACGSEDEAPAAQDPTSGAGEAFPATVGTKFGDVVVESAPTRVVALGWGDAETALALGVQPVGASDWLAFGGEGVGPWAEGLYDQAPEIVGTLEPSYEAIAALRPDLILDVKSSGDQERYDKLSQIATTVGVPEGGDSYLITTQAQVTMIATALGRLPEGQALLDGIDQAFAAAAEAHPQWAGKTATAASRTSRGWGAYVEGSERVGFLENLGFVQNPAVAALPVGETGFSIDISAEELPVVDGDLVVVFPIGVDAADITSDPVWQAVPAVADGRAIVLERDVSSAYSLAGALSTKYALEKMVPLLEQALPA